MTPNPTQARSLIINRAKKLVEELVHQRGHAEPPFLPSEYGNILGVKKVTQQNLGKLGGLLLRFPKYYIVKLNINDKIVRQNFSYAHEIGHILFSELKLGYFVREIEYRTFDPLARNKLQLDTRERLCDAAATELLMPEAIFKSHLSRIDLSIDSITQLADTFNVSVQAAAKRTSEISSEPCMAYFWKFDKLKKQIYYSWSSGPGISQRHAFLMPISKNVSPPSTLHDAYKQDNCFKSYKSFKRGNVIERLNTESKGFGIGDSRYVLSLVILNKDYWTKSHQITGDIIGEG
ncbi:MAG: ImmA/IrrE family metallo-endopeptidase [Dehalococcoidales bacterium]|nr:ImmA/IrrE family metallo-endopeptidase [Dehalococcoidales bacterium]